MPTEPPTKIGRGGAGNFWSKRDLEDAAKPATEDLEAQRTSSTAAPLTRTPTTSQQPEYARSGRGGAGNLVSATEAAAAAAAEEGAAATLSTVRGGAPVVAAVPTHVGRGGAGNWRADEEGRRQREEEAEGRARRDVDARVRVEVEMGLRMPPRAYKAPGAGGLDG